MTQHTEGEDRQDMNVLLEHSLWRGESITWDDIVGHATAKRELAVVAEQLRRHSVAERLGLTLVKGILILGPPGSGKTMLAKALAAAVNRPAYVIPSSEVDAKTIGRVYAALSGKPCVVVWDEADVLLRARWARAGTEDAGRTAAAFASAIDGAHPLRGPITVGLTAEDEHTLDRQGYAPAD